MAARLLVVLVSVLFTSVDVLASSGNCTCADNTYDTGQSVVGADGCHVCHSGPYGVSCVRTNTTAECLTKGPTHSVGDRACTYGGDVGAYIGDVFTARDGCNTCLCTEQGLACTGKPCSNAGFAQPHRDMYGHCRYKEAGENVWYPFNSQWQAIDGCNTCICVAIGNYQGHYICTNGMCVNPHHRQSAAMIG